jgi:hypothetical protein
VTIVTWHGVLPRWVGLLLGLGSGLGIPKAALLLVAGVDLGPLALLGAVLLTAGFAGTASSLWRTTTAGGQSDPHCDKIQPAGNASSSMARDTTER